ncbi:MAG: bifunctional precorrin-2 dehydrogenase/sirohydrochlorin ferrochelatase [Chloroflexi bacterium]|nr:bifunctional precorrin-2 dehydrogenase/sirohydrochlorin ferrochelatase [Chloroflexota bacterium]
MALYPIALRLEGRRCLVVGGGRVAERKIAALLDARAEVVVIAPEITPALRELATQGQVVLHEREVVASDVIGATLVIAAADIPQVNGIVWQACRAAGVLINTVDVPTHSDFYTPAVVRRAPVTVAITTDGHSPGLSVWLRRHLEAALPARIGELAETLGNLRAQVGQAIRERTERAAFWNRVVDDQLVALAEQEGMDAVRERVAAALADWPTREAAP